MSQQNYVFILGIIVLFSDSSLGTFHGKIQEHATAHKNKMFEILILCIPKLFSEFLFFEITNLDPSPWTC